MKESRTQMKHSWVGWVLLLIFLTVGGLFAPMAQAGVAQPRSCAFAFEFHGSSSSRIDSHSQITLADENFDRRCLVESYFCQFAERSHYRTAINPLTNGRIEQRHEDYVGRTAIVSIEGLGVIGLLKNVGDSTFLSLVDVVDRSGSKILEKGMFYRPTAKLAEEVEAIWIENPKAQFPSIRLKTILLDSGRHFRAGIVAENRSFVEAIKIKLKRRTSPTYSRPLTEENLSERLEEVLAEVERIDRSRN